MVRNLLDVLVEVPGEGPDLLDGAATPLAPIGASAFEEPESDAADLPEVTARTRLFRISE